MLQEVCEFSGAHHHIFCLPRPLSPTMLSEYRSLHLLSRCIASLDAPLCFPASPVLVDCLRWYIDNGTADRWKQTTDRLQVWYRVYQIHFS